MTVNKSLSDADTSDERIYVWIATILMWPLRKLSKNSKGFTLVEVVVVIVVLAIAIPALVQLSAFILEKGDKSAVVSRAALLAQEKIEEILADKRDTTKGYDWIIASGSYPTETLPNGYTRRVTVTTNTRNGVDYAHIRVAVEHDDIPDIELVTWLTDY